MTKFEQIIARTIESLSKAELKGVNSIYKYQFYQCSLLTKLEFPDTVTSISSQACAECTSLPNIVIPKNVNQLLSGCFQKNDAMAWVRFEQPAGMAITLPTAGSTGTGMFYSKTARAMDVYTDNETIKNYAWASDNITATFYHLDGTAWN